MTNRKPCAHCGHISSMEMLDGFIECEQCTANVPTQWWDKRAADPLLASAPPAETLQYVAKQLAELADTFGEKDLMDVASWLLKVRRMRG